LVEFEKEIESSSVEESIEESKAEEGTLQLHSKGKELSNAWTHFRWLGKQGCKNRSKSQHEES
jgi:hypothetical protein